MVYLRGGWEQTTMFPVTVDEFDLRRPHVSGDSGVCRATGHGETGFVPAELDDTRSPGSDPRDLPRLYLYGYLQRVRSSRRLEADCGRNVELKWRMGRLQADSKSRGCGLLQWRTGRNLRSPGHRTACTCPARRGQPRRRCCLPRVHTTTRRPTPFRCPANQTLSRTTAAGAMRHNGSCTVTFTMGFCNACSGARLQR